MTEQIRLVGKSGSIYIFEVYEIDSDLNPKGGKFKKDFGAVYAFAKRESINGKKEVMEPPIYIGQTEDLSRRFNDHHKATCIKANKADCICICPQQNEVSRKKIESDLIEGYKPTPCNG